MLFVTVTECTDFLRVHPVEVALFAGIAPGPDAAVVSQSHCVRFSDRKIYNFQTLFSKSINKHRRLNSSIILITLPKHPIVPFSPHIQLSFFSYSPRMLEPKPDLSHLFLFEKVHLLR